MPYTNASSEAIGQGAWHGAAVTSNGFALRFDASGTKVRLFNNSGVPQGPNINLATLTCHPEAAGGGRGDGIGFKGNGRDAYVYACNSTVGPWVTVLNADGTLRYSRKVGDLADNPTGGGSDRLGVDMAADGRVIVAFQAGNNDTNNPSFFGLPQARIFDPCGRPIGPVFYLSERDNPTNPAVTISNGDRGRPRVAWRGSTIAAMWGTLNSPNSLSRTLSFRIFDAPAIAPCAPAPTVTIVRSGNDVLISWPESFGAMTLQATSSLSPPVAWACVNPQPAIVTAGGQNMVTVPISATNQFFRLHQ